MILSVSSGIAKCRDYLSTVGGPTLGFFSAAWPLGNRFRVSKEPLKPRLEPSPTQQPLFGSFLVPRLPLVIEASTWRWNDYGATQ